MPSHERPSMFPIFGAIILLALATCAFSQPTHATGAAIVPGPLRSNYEHPLPPSLVGRITEDAYNQWLRIKIKDLLAVDRRRGRPFAKPGAQDLYREKIEEALAENALIDPFTGDTLDWSLVNKWRHGDDEKAFNLLPTVDHKDPCSPVLEFELCSWLSNRCKSCMTPEEFVALCAKIVDQSGSIPSSTKPVSLSTSLKCPVRYVLPSFLEGICTPEKFRHWIDKKAKVLFQRDKKKGRSSALNGTKESYKQTIYAAVIAAGLCDPYTGEKMDWAIIGTWDPVGKNYDPGTFKKKYSLLPTVDHTNPDKDTLEFEICSWIVNSCKNDMNRDEFLAFCKKVAAYRSPGQSPQTH